MSKSQRFKIIYTLVALTFSLMGEANNIIQVIVVQKSDDVWMVHYQLPTAVKKVSFYRNSSFDRTDWSLIDKDLVISTDSLNKTTVNSSQGTVFKHFTLQFNTSLIKRPDDYPLNVAFSDGGLLLYTGHLMLIIDELENTSHAFKFASKLAGHSIVNGQKDVHMSQSIDNDLAGQYIYFGPSKPSESKYMVAVIDPEVPIWIQQKLKRYLPPLLQFYTQQFNTNLNYKPVIYFSFAADGNSGAHYSGGVLPGQIQLKITGNGWQQDSEYNSKKLLHFIAHEAAHLWNYLPIKVDRTNQVAWLHEGSAEAFALRALLDLGVIQKTDVLKGHENLLNECMDSLLAQPPKSLTDSGNFQAQYACGATIALMTELFLSNQSSQLSLFGFWSNLIDKLQIKNMVLTVEEYLNSLSSHLGSAETTSFVNQLRLLIDTPQQDLIKYFKESFQSLGAEVMALQYHPSQTSKNLENALKHIMTLDCNGYSFTHHGNTYEVGGHLTCHNIIPGMQINKIMHLPVSTAGNAIHAAVLRSCQSGQEIALSGLNDQAIQVLCTRQLPAPNPWLKINARQMNLASDTQNS